MSNTPTTPASVASRLTDKNIELMADNAEADGWISTAAVLRDYVRMRNENSQLKARLEAVVKECESVKWNCDGTDVVENVHVEGHNYAIDAILRAARGEGGAE